MERLGAGAGLHRGPHRLRRPARKAIPSATVRSTGNPKLQKTVEGSRKNPRSRASVSCQSGEDRRAVSHGASSR